MTAFGNSGHGEICNRRECHCVIAKTVLSALRKKSCEQLYTALSRQVHDKFMTSVAAVSIRGSCRGKKFRFDVSMGLISDNANLEIIGVDSKGSIQPFMVCHFPPTASTLNMYN
jgi:hypothetical protein